MATSPDPKPSNGNGPGNGPAPVQPGADAPPQRPSGISIQTALILVVVIALGAIGFAVYQFNTTRRLERAAEQARLAMERMQAEAALERTRGEESARLTLAVNRQKELLTRVRNNTNTLGTLFQQVEQVQTEAARLSTNAAGRTVARHPDLVALARRCYEQDLAALPARDDLLTKIESARRLGQQLLDAAGTQFDPPADMSVSLQDQGLWADQALRQVGQVRKTLDSLTREAQIKTTPEAGDTEPPTLEAAIRQLTLAEAEERQRILVAVTTEARQAAVTNLAQAEAERTLREAQLEANRILQAAKEAAAQQQREFEQRAAQAKVEQAQGDVARQQKEAEAVNITSRARAADPAVQSALAPFVTPGHYRPKGMTYDKKPHSLTELRMAGMLDPTVLGLQRLIELAMYRLDKERPRWKLSAYGRVALLTPADLEKVKHAQQLLIELGPALVELGLLDP